MKVVDKLFYKTKKLIYQRQEFLYVFFLIAYSFVQVRKTWNQQKLNETIVVVVIVVKT